MSDQPITGRAGFPPAPELPEPWKAAHQTALHLLLALGWAAREAACRCGQRPADSVPGTKGTCGLIWYFPATKSAST